MNCINKCTPRRDILVDKIKVVKMYEDVILPKYETSQSAGMDLRAYIKEPIIIKPSSSVLIKTGLKIQLPIGYEMQIRPRSGLALNNGITVLNSPGTIDADYRGEVGIILINHGKKEFIVNNGDRIAQAVVNKVEQLRLCEVDNLDMTERNDGGFGSTGK